MQREGNQRLVNYPAAKAVPVSFALSLSRQVLPQYGVRVNAVASGYPDGFPE